MEEMIEPWGNFGKTIELYAIFCYTTKDIATCSGRAAMGNQHDRQLSVDRAHPALGALFAMAGAA